MIGQKVTELKNGNQGNQATMEPMYSIYITLPYVPCLPMTWGPCLPCLPSPVAHPPASGACYDLKRGLKWHENQCL